MYYTAGSTTGKKKGRNSVMQQPMRYSLVRKILFPYSGEEPLTWGQGVRVLLSWMLFFAVPLALLSAGLMLLVGYDQAGVISGMLFVFFSGAGIFGLLGLVIVVMSNRAARIRMAWKARQGRS
jgi:hypothetical protein